MAIFDEKIEIGERCKGVPTSPDWGTMVQAPLHRRQVLMARQFSRPGNYRVVVSHERHLCCCLVVVSVVLLCFRPIFPFSSFQPFLFIGGFDSSALCRSRRELSNACLLEKVGFDPAENEPLEVWGENSIQYSLHSLVPAGTNCGALEDGCQIS